MSIRSRMKSWTRKPTYTTIRIVAKNDPNGNPRRAYLTFSEGTLVAVYCEGYSGIEAITKPRHRRAYKNYDIHVPVTEFQYRLKQIPQGE